MLSRNRRSLLVRSIFTSLIIMLSFGTANAVDYKLSERSKHEFKIFIELVDDASERKNLTDTLLLMTPFLNLLEKPDLTTVFQISTTDWNLLRSASQGMSVHLRSQLRSFCQLEAIKQSSSPVDFKFWNNLADQFKNPN